MIWTRLTNRRSARRVAAVDDLRFPASGRQRLANQHHHLSDDDIRLVEAATRQWFRLVARHPKATLVVPSSVVDDLWQELALHVREYATFCDVAFGRTLSPPPRQAAVADPQRAGALLATLGYARRDDGSGPTALPLLFRVDEDLHIRGGRRYLADCGGRGECFQVAGMVCLQHVGGTGKRLRAGGIRGDLPFHDGRYGYAGGTITGESSGGDVGIGGGH
jgi:hypothetical protein